MKINFRILYVLLLMLVITTCTDDGGLDLTDDRDQFLGAWDVSEAF